MSKNDVLHLTHLQHIFRNQNDSLARFFIVKNRLMSDEPVTLQGIGDKFGISRERARQIESATIKKLKALLIDES